MSSSNSNPRLRILPVLIGAPVGIFCILFAMANDAWVTIHIPSAPWSAIPSYPAFEATMWGVMLISLLAGLSLSFFLAAAYHRKHAREALKQQEHLRELETELQRVSRLLGAIGDKG